MPLSTKRIIISTGSVNSFGFRTLTEGIDLTGFTKNPLMLWNHIRPDGTDRNQILPIGHWEDIQLNDDELSGVPFFDDHDTFAMSIFHKVEDGHIRMSSAGFVPIEVDDDPSLMIEGQTLPTVTKSFMKEVSIVDMGSNPDSLDVVLYDTADGIINLKDIDYLKLFSPLNKITMKRKPSAAEVTAAKNLLLLAEKGGVTKPSAAKIADAKAVIKLAEETAPAADDEEKLADDVDINADPTTLDDDQKNALILALQKMVADQGQKLADTEEQAQLAADAAETEKCTNLADKAVALRKISLSEKPLYIRLAKADYEGTVQLLESKKTTTTLRSALETGASGGAAKEDKITKRLLTLADKSFNELFNSKTGDLEFLKLNDYDTYSEKYEAKFGRKPATKK
jgi:hypothetical protein